MSNVERLKQKWAEQDEAEIDAAINALVQHRHGRRLLWWLLTIGRIGLQPFQRNALDTAFSCGELNVGQRILDRLITVNPQGYVEMMKENADERGKRDAQLRGAAGADRAGTEFGEPDGQPADDGYAAG